MLIDSRPKASFNGQASGEAKPKKQPVILALNAVVDAGQRSPNLLFVAATCGHQAEQGKHLQQYAEIRTTACLAQELVDSFSFDNLLNIGLPPIRS